MTDHDALKAAVRARPGEQTPKLVLADYYEDHDMPHHAAVWRAFGGTDADNVRTKAAAASEAAYRRSAGAGFGPGWTQTARNRGEEATSLYATDDPETAARDHIDDARNHNDFTDQHLGNDDTEGAKEHMRAMKLHHEAAHALSPGLAARAAHGAAMHGEGGMLWRDVRDAAYQSTYRASHADSLGAKADAHLDAADAHDRLTKQSAHPERHVEAARLHRVAAAYYHALHQLA